MSRATLLTHSLSLAFVRQIIKSALLLLAIVTRPTMSKLSGGHQLCCQGGEEMTLNGECEGAAIGSSYCLALFIHSFSSRAKTQEVNDSMWLLLDGKESKNVRIWVKGPPRFNGKCLFRNFFFWLCKKTNLAKQGGGVSIVRFQSLSPPGSFFNPLCSREWATTLRVEREKRWQMKCGQKFKNNHVT